MTNEEEIRTEYRKLIEAISSWSDVHEAGLDYFITKLKAQDKIAREEMVKKIEKGFDEFLLQDWSGEVEVENEIERLKGIIISSLNPSPSH